MYVDLLVHNADILTLDDERPRARTMAVHHGRVLALDPGEGLRGRRTLDAGGATITPGFGDAHNHMAWFGLALDEIDLTGVTDLGHLYALVRERAGSTAEGGWVVGSGYDDTRIGGHPHRLELDRAAGGRPVWLKHRSGHVSAVSTPVLEQVGVLSGEAEVPEGGIVVRDGEGPTGVLEEQAQNLVVAVTTPYPVDGLSRAVARASEVYAAEGLTHVTEAGIGHGWLGRSPSELAAYQAARERGDLRTRVQLMPAITALHALEGHEDDLMRLGLDLGICTGFGDDALRIGPLKIWLDGSMVARTAALTEPFSDRPETSGYLQDDPDVMRERMLAAHRGGWRIAAHAIGDRAVDLALDVFEAAQAVHVRPDARHRIEHAGVTRPEQVERMARLGVTPVPQHRFLHGIGDTMLAAVGEKRADQLYRHAGFLAAGLRVPGSSDRPVVEGAPLAGMQSMVERRSSGGVPIGPDERVDALTALRAYTLDTAWAAGEERDRGTLSPGKLADFVLLDRDVTAVPAEEIGSTQVIATFVGGRATHGEEAVGRTT